MLKFLFSYFIVNLVISCFFLILDAEFIFKWYDLWIGFYYDKNNRVLYYFLIPTLGFRLELIKWLQFKNENCSISKYQPGDKVKIKDSLELYKQYGNIIYNEAMIRFCLGEEDEIKYQVTEGEFKGSYRLERLPFFWSEKMLEKIEE